MAGKTVVEREVIIMNRQGLHARPVMQFVDTASRFASEVKVEKNNTVVDGKSPMEMMLLEATKGTRLKVKACGEDAAQAVQALAELVERGFGEDDECSLAS
jgi:phosphocarrier protein HPr